MTHDREPADTREDIIELIDALNYEYREANPSNPRKLSENGYMILSQHCYAIAQENDFTLIQDFYTAILRAMYASRVHGAENHFIRLKLLLNQLCPTHCQLIESLIKAQHADTQINDNIFTSSCQI